MQSSNDSLSAPPVSGSPAVLLTPGRTRNIAQDMEALRLSRQDNPYLQQVMASRESLIESHSQDCESDDTILMSQEFGSAALDFAEDDPLTLKEVHEHMIRSPPPTSSWPHEMPYRAASAFDFSADSPISYSAYSVNSQDKEYLGGKSPRRKAEESRNTPSRPRSSRSVSPRSHDLTLCGRPLSLPDHIVQLHRSLGFGRQMKHKYAMELAHVLRLVALEEVRPKPTLTATTTTDPHHRTRKSPSYGAQ